MYISNQQYVLVFYLFKQLNFVEDDFFKLYIDELLVSAKKFGFLGSIPEEYELQESGGQISTLKTLKNSNRYHEYKIYKGIAIPTNFNIIDFLFKELETKRNRDKVRKINGSNLVSATDISSFSFCPVSYAINKTLEIPKLQSTQVGTDLHEKSRLSNFSLRDQVSNESEIVTVENKEFFKDIKNSTVIFEGHNLNNKNKFFKNTKKSFIGQPDYVFLNDDGHYFIVEEKYHYVNDAKQLFYENHKYQLLSYIHFIEEYNISYGYLVYWKYSYGYDNEVNMDGCLVLKLNKDANSKSKLENILNSVKHFYDTKEILFNKDQRNPKKCASCVSNLFCGHKSGNFDLIKFPYSDEYFKTKYLKYSRDVVHFENTAKEYLDPDDFDIQISNKNDPNALDMNELNDVLLPKEMIPNEVIWVNIVEFDERKNLK